MPPHSKSGRGPGVSVLAVSPSAPQIAYAGIFVREAPGLAPWSAVYETTDGGTSWRRKSKGPEGFENVVGSAMAIDPTNPQLVFMSTARGLFRSPDGGRHWHSLRIGFAAGLVINSRAPREIYAASAGVAKSTDGGITWKWWQPYRAVSRDGCCWALAMDPRHPSVLYTGARGAVYKTTDAGRTWVRQSKGLPRRRSGDRTGGAVEVDALAVDPRRPKVVYAGMPAGLYRSTNGGRTWARTSEAYIFDVVIDPGSGAVYVNAGACPPPCQENRAGVLKSSNGGASWVVKDEGFPNVGGEFAVLALALG